MAPARILSRSTATRPGGRLGVLLTLLALFGLAVVGSWHANHPDLPETVATIHAAATGNPDKLDLDHLTEHAALHAIGLPALPITVMAVPMAVAIFHPLAPALPASTTPPRPLRPPQG